MNDIKISIITVSLNSEKTIEQTIQSVLTQDYANIEYIIIDGGSTDGTADIIRKYSKDIAYWVSEPDGGKYEAINKGIRKASGEVIGIINSDDWYEAGAIKQAAELFSDHDADIISGGLRFYSGEGILMYEMVYPSGNPLEGMAWGHPAVFVAKKIYDVLGDYDNTYDIAADYKFLLKCYLEEAKFFYTPKIFANFRNIGISTTDSLLREEEAYRAKKENICDSRLSEAEKKEWTEKAEIKLSYFRGIDCISDNDRIRHIRDILEIENGVFLFGYGIWGKRVLSFLINNGITIKGVIDNDTDKQGKIVEKTSVEILPAEFIRGKGDTVLICTEKDAAIIEQLSLLDVDNFLRLRDFCIKIGMLKV